MVDVSEKGRSGHGFSTERREERRRMRSEFPRWGNERADESHTPDFTAARPQIAEAKTIPAPTKATASHFLMSGSSSSQPQASNQAPRPPIKIIPSPIALIPTPRR